MNKIGMDILMDPALNKSTAFSMKERKVLHLEGLVPEKQESEALQLQRVLMQLSHKTNDLDRYIYLVNLLDHNEILFYQTIMSDPMRFLPIIYDPTIGEACLKFGHIYRQARGMYLSLNHQGKIKEVLKNWPQTDIRFICVSNGGRILGLGDLGANGMGIPIGKLQLYTVAAGVPPQYLLPILIDVGTNNERLLKDPLYLGLRKKRPSTERLFEFTDEFVEAVQCVFPKCCIHFEDWTGVDAIHLLERYRNKVCCYNDDIQGTAATTLAGMLNACRIKNTSLKDESFLFLGAGSAGIGLSNLLCTALVQQGLSLSEARSRIHLFDVNGLLEASRSDLFDFQKPFAHPNQPMPANQLKEAIKLFKPTALIGVSTQGGAFSRDIIETMATINKRPIILALSNPTDHAECTAFEAYTWSNGKAIFAAGVSFPPVRYKTHKFLPGQANNFYIFPAVGMALFACQASRVPDELFIEAAKALAAQVHDEDLKQGLLYPLQSGILQTETHTAAQIAQALFDLKLAGIKKPKNLTNFIKKQIFKPKYPSLIKKYEAIDKEYNN